MPPRPTSSLAGARLALGLVSLCCAATVAQAFYLINPLSYWPASNVSGNIVFQVGLVASPPNVPNPPLTDGSATWDAAFVTQMNAWNAILPDTVLNLQAVVGAPVPGLEGEGNGVNNVFFSGTIYGDTWGSSTAGICLSFWSGNVRTEADVLFNSTKTWNAYTGNLQGGTTDFRRVALHELGHALLLDHPDDVGQSVSAIMNSVSSNTDALTADDIAGVTAVFGALVPVTITVQPRAPVTTNGGNGSFSVTATGSVPITYQWQRSTNGGGSWSDLAGFTFPNGSYGPFNSDNDGNLFRVVATNQLGSVTSQSVMLIVTGGASEPSFGLDPASATISEGADVIFTAHAAGSPAPTYQWQYSTNGGSSWQGMFSSFGTTDVAGITSPALRISHAIAAINGYQFRARATNGSGTVDSAAATLTVNAGGPAPYFTWQPLDVYAQSGTVETLIVAGTAGSPTPARQWQRSTDGGINWNNVPDDATFDFVTASTLRINNVSLGMSGHLFRLNLTNGSGNATSRVVTLSVGSAAAAPTVTDGPDNVNLAAVGQDATFAAVVTALPAPVFQWEISPDGVTYSAISDGAVPLGTITLATIASGANSRTLTVTNVDASLDTFRFRLVVRNASGSATSAAATLTIGVGTAPSITAPPSNTTKVVGENATFTATADGTPTPSLQWQRSTNGGSSWNNLSNDVTFSGVTTGTLTVTSVTLAMSGHQFRLVATNGILPDANSNAATLTVNASTARLINLSVRTGAGTGSQTLIVGFVVGGTGSNQVLVRGIGPTLGSFGVPGVLADPQLRIYSGNTLLQENDDWGGGATLSNAFAAVFAFALPAASKDAAMLATLNSGSYTTHCSSTAGTGIALVELYDMLAPGSTARLINVSARTQVETGDGILIAGFVIDGVTSKTLLIRGIGPTLGDFGVGGVLADPHLALYSGNTVVQSNDNWGGTAPLTTAFSTVFAFALPAASTDAAMLVTLAPGTYTAQVSGVGATTGVALVEVYEMP